MADQPTYAAAAAGTPEADKLMASDSSSKSYDHMQGSAMNVSDHPDNNIGPMQTFEHSASAQGIKPGFGAGSY